MIVGVTGCPGSGKSLIAEIMRDEGWALIDADFIGRDVVESDEAVLDELAESFGRDILDDAGTLDRRKLAGRAFADRESTERLNRIVHPRLIARLNDEMNKANAVSRNTVVDCALIFEWGIGESFDLLVCVRANEDIRRGRIMERDGRSETEIDDMFAAQMPEELKASQADIVIANNGALKRMTMMGKMLAGVTM